MKQQLKGCTGITLLKRLVNATLGNPPRELQSCAVRGAVGAEPRAAGGAAQAEGDPGAGPEREAGDQEPGWGRGRAFGRSVS